ncbi:uncharacterized protein KY384_006488 [Bacidia gigantensis]|uniref:uncharacterized protein n=1 Tax=Bacidia gigantensis TaxID=2732470 RepID=UPI001D036B83|nr:uncharacterized protein KY384_006488 [Bacidia gigantensis]KAG8528800.1 hypothetical protein KY384_006488 [Bacidia gigantensis]
MHKRLLGSISRRGSANSSEKSIPNGDSPEATAARGVRLFCESGGPNNSGEEVLHLPTIVEAAESSPAAASRAASEIRKFLSSKNFQRAYVQYNAIMLVRILADNPGKSFTKNIDKQFVATVKELLRDGRDMSVQQILRETLDSFESQKPEDETLLGLKEMWKKEKTKVDKRLLPGNHSMSRAYPPPATNPQQQQNYFARSHRPKGLPTPAELAQRVEEAKTSAKLLSQLVQSTPPAEVLANDLIKEFADRCQSASRSMQSYINSDSPAPDEDTLLTLIETNDQLATAMSRHQRAVLQARRLTSLSPQQTPQQTQGPYEAPGNPPNGTYPAPAGPPPTKQQHQDPFADPSEHQQQKDVGGLQEPLVPSNYGLPPDEVAVPGATGSQPGRQAQPPLHQPQPQKARYRF